MKKYSLKSFGGSQINPLEKAKNSPYMYLSLAFLLPVFINLLIFIIKGVYPFGESSVLVLDLNGQYVYFFEAMRDILKGNGSPFYTWYRSLGGEFSGIYAYYVASPFTLITLLFPDGGMVDALLVMTLAKVGACGLTFGIYLHNCRPSNNRIAVIMFSTIYALTSYAVVQAMNTMWIDALIYLPLIIYGLELIVHKGRFTLYTVSLALCFIANFYIGFMMAIFVSLYFIYYYFSKYTFKPFRRTFIVFYKWMISSECAAAIAAVIIIPTYYSLKFGKTTFSDPTYEFTSKFDILEIFTQMLPCSYDTVRPEGLPFIYCGVISLILLPIYFITKKIKPREKMMSAGILAIMCLSFMGSTIDLFWHGMQKPNWLNYRYSFMFCFLVLVFAYEAFIRMEAKLYRPFLSVCAAVGIITVICQKFEYEQLDDIFSIWFVIVLLGLYIAIFYYVLKKKSKAAQVVLITLVSCEIFLSGLYDVFALHEDVYYSTRKSYVSFMERYSGIVGEIQSMDSSLYRMEKTDHRKTNDNMTLRMRGISNSTSTLNASVITLLNKMGYASKSHWSKYVGGNPVSDSLLGIKYVISPEDDLANEYEKILTELDPTSLDDTQKKELYAFVNNYALPILYGVDSGILDVDIEEYGSAFDFLNAVVSAMLGYDAQIFVPITNTEFTYDNIRLASADKHHKYAVINEDSTAYVKWTFTASSDRDIYIHLPSIYPRDTKLSINGGSAVDYLTNDTHTVYRAGSFDEGEEVSFKFTLKDTAMYVKKDTNYFCYFDKDTFVSAMNALKSGGLNVYEFSDTKIVGSANVKKDQTQIFTTIPYDEGWSVRVDGKKVELQKTLNSLLSFTVSEGEHNIVLKFAPQGYYIGLAISVSGIVLLVVFTVLSYKKRNKRLEKIKASILVAENNEIESICENNNDEENKNE